MLTVAAPARPMRSAGAPLLFVPRVRSNSARRAFSVAGPTIFNSLPPEIRLSHSIDNRHFQATPKDSPFYDALVCPPPSASVFNDIIGATQMMFYLYLMYMWRPTWPENQPVQLANATLPGCPVHANEVWWRCPVLTFRLQYSETV